MAKSKLPTGKKPTGGPKEDKKSAKNKSIDTSTQKKSGDGAHRGGSKFEQVAFKPGFVILDTGTKKSEPGKKSKN